MTGQEVSEPQEALSMLDARGHRMEIIPAEVKGFFRTRRTLVYWVLILIFMALPWIKINGMQAVLIDIVGRKFEIFGVRFWSHDGPLIIFILGTLAIGLALLTALFGRVWCGWACPQTVFIDAIYRQIEIWIEGNYIARRKLRQSPMSPEKFIKSALKWLSFIVVSSVIAHSFIAYFSGSDKLLAMIQGSPQQNWNYFLLVTAMTGILSFNFGWFREQFCIIMCPYGRFQSVLHDADSVTVLYDETRGEPRRGTASGDAKTGDCVACNRCVQVCPTGIDIRKGVQLECIACSACVDACNEIMAKVHKPPNLIRYDSLRGGKIRYIRPRVVLYAVVLAIFITGLGANLANRSGFMVTLLRAIETPYQVLKNEDKTQVINHFRLHLHNQESKSQQFEIIVPPDWKEKNIQLTLPNQKIDVEATSEKEIHFFVLFSPDILDEKGRASTEIKIIGEKPEEAISKSLFLLGPEKH